MSEFDDEVKEKVGAFKAWADAHPKQATAVYVAVGFAWGVVTGWVWL